MRYWKQVLTYCQYVSKISLILHLYQLFYMQYWKLKYLSFTTKKALASKISFRYPIYYLLKSHKLIPNNLTFKIFLQSLHWNFVSNLPMANCQLLKNLSLIKECMINQNRNIKKGPVTVECHSPSVSIYQKLSKFQFHLSVYFYILFWYAN